MQFLLCSQTMEEVKIILLGDSGVGKTSLITRFISEDDSSFARKNSAPRSSQFDPDVKAKEVDINGKTIKVCTTQTRSQTPLTWESGNEATVSY